MAIKHLFESAKPDGPEADGLVRPSDWNDDHVIEDETITDDMLVESVRIPVGGIIMWSGLIAAIPTRWALCNGIANAPGPDLRDKFIVGAKQDDAGAAKSNIEGSLKVSGGSTGHSHSGHANLSHAGGLVGDHTGLTHELAIADHPDLTHAALSHAATTITQPDAAVPTHSASHAAMTGSRPSLAVAAVTGSRPSLAVAATTGSRPSLAVAAVTGSRPSLAVAAVTGSRPSGSIASHAAGSVPSGSIASRADLSMPSGSIAANAAVSVPSGSFSIASGTHSHAASTISGVVSVAVSRSVITTGGLNLSHMSAGSGVTVTNASFTGTHASATGSVVSLANASGPSATVASHAAGSMPSLTIASAANASGPSRTFASGADISVPSQAIASGVDISIASQAIASGVDISIASQAIASGVDISIGSQAIASGADISIPSASHSHASSAVAVADLSLPSLSHQAIGTHVGTDYGVHDITQPDDHGVAGTLVHAVTQPDPHVLSAHDTVSNVPSYFSLAFIQRMAA